MIIKRLVLSKLNKMLLHITNSFIKKGNESEMNSNRHHSMSDPDITCNASSSPKNLEFWYRESPSPAAEDEVVKVLYGDYASNERLLEKVNNNGHCFFQKYNNCYEFGNRTEFIYNKASGGSLDEYISKRGALKDKEIRIVAYRLLRALELLHAEKMCHNDIRPANIVLLEENDFTTAVLSNFVVSSCEKKIEGFYGMEWFSPPEALRETHHSYRADIWAAGITLFFIATNSFPYNIFVKKDMYAEIFSGMQEMKKTTKWSSMDEDLRDLISKMLRVAPEKRIKAKEALKHQFFKIYKDQ